MAGMGKARAPGLPQASIEKMTWLPPVFFRTGAGLQPGRKVVSGTGSSSASTSAGGSRGGVGVGEDSHRQQERGGGSRAAEPSPLPQSPPTNRRLVAVVLLSVVVFVATAAARRISSSWHQQQQQLQQPRLAAGGRDSSSDGSLSKLPFLEGQDGGGDWQGKLDASHWVRVRSPSAMHPAMYVPGDGMVYCPIAKVRKVEGASPTAVSTVNFVLRREPSENERERERE